MASLEFTLLDHSDEVLRARESQIEAALEGVGNNAVTYAKQNIDAAIPRNGASWYHSSGALQNSIDHRVVKGEKAVYVGTNLDYAVYNEMGTGKYATGGGGRQGWWGFVPGSSGGGKLKGKRYTEEEARRIVAILKSKGLDAHMTQGIKPIHFLKKAAADHIEEYKGIIKQELSK